MELNGNALGEEVEVPTQKHTSNGIRVRDMIKRYDTAIKSDSTKSSYSSIVSSKSSYFGVNAANAPISDNSSNSLLTTTSPKVQDLTGSPSRSSCGSRGTVRNARSPSIEMPNDVQVAVPLDNQKSFMNLSRSREPPRAAPREKKARHTPPAMTPVPVPLCVPTVQQQQQQQQQLSEEHLNTTDSSYQSKTTISKTPSGVRIIIDIFFDQNKGLTIEDVVGSRVETDIPPSKILTEFQKRVADSARN